MQATFVVDESKPRKKARLSWYHPDDTVRRCFVIVTPYRVVRKSVRVRLSCWVEARCTAGSIISVHHSAPLNTFH